MIFICPLDICAYKINCFFLFNNIHTKNKNIQTHTNISFFFFLSLPLFFSFLFLLHPHLHKIQTIKKITKLTKYYNENYKNNLKLFRTVANGLLELPEQCSAEFWELEQLWRVDLTHHRHWRRVGPRAAVKKTTRNRGVCNDLLPPSFLAGGENGVTCKAKQNPTSSRF